MVTIFDENLNFKTSITHRTNKMDSKESSNEKELKQLKNLELKQPKNATNPEKNKNTDQQKNSADSDNEVDISPSFQRIRELFKKTEEMKEMAKEKNREVEDQFESLRERLNGSSLFLNQMKASIENLRFSYQRKLMDNREEDFEDYMNNREKFKNKEEMNSYLDQLKGKIETLKTNPSVENVEEDEPQDYQTALKDVVSNLKIIDEGLYSSGNKFGKENK